MTPERISTLRGWASSQPLVGMLYAFGSRVRGTSRPDSDLDVAVELDPTAAVGNSSIGQLDTWLGDTAHWKEQLTAATGVVIDLQQYAGPINTPGVHEGLADSALLLYRKPGFTSAYPVPSAPGLT